MKKSNLIKMIFLSFLTAFYILFSMNVYASTQQKLSTISEEQANVLRKQNNRDHIPIITIDDLRTKFGKVIIVDARSHFEYNTLHISGALSLPVSTRGFEVGVQKLRKKHPNKDIIFYCNGFVCGKSYAATERATKKGLSGVYAFDRGIFAWADKYPELSVLLGQEKIDRSKLIPDTVFDQHNLEVKEFLEQSKAAFASGGLIIDIRTVSQRETYAPINSVRKVETDLFAKVINSFKGSALYVIDQNGEQVRWLQYHLQKHGIKEYYFMKGGMHAYSNP